MVPLLSSAARMPLPGATNALAVTASSSAVMATSLVFGLLQWPAQAVVGRTPEPADSQPRKVTSTATSGGIGCPHPPRTPGNGTGAAGTPRPRRPPRPG